LTFHNWKSFTKTLTTNEESFMDNKRNEYILYLDTRSFPPERDAEIEAAKKAGLEIVMATDSPSQYTDYKVSHIIETPLGDYESATQTIIQYLSSNNLKVNGVVAWGDNVVELAARIGKVLNLPSSSPEASQNVRNKVNTRKILDQLDSANPKYAVIGNYEDFQKALETVGTPCLLKPAGASFGRGIFRINSYEDASSIFQQYIDYCVPSRDEIYSYFKENFLLEEYLNGTEHSVAGMVTNGEVYVLAIADKKIDKSIPFQYENIIPSRLSEGIKEQVLILAKAAVKLLGINWCGFHIDFIVDKTGIAKILEIGGRLGGEAINSHLIPLSTPDIHPYDLILKVVQGNNPFERIILKDNVSFQAGLRAFMPTSSGKILSLEGFDKVKHHPNTRVCVQLKQVNDTVFLPSEKIGHFAVGYVIASCGEKENIEEILDDIASLVKVEI
jgi:biotin carboxylase